MKKLQAILFGAALVGTGQVHALINDGKFGGPGELFIAVYDSAGQQSYYMDLGVTMTQVLQTPSSAPSVNLAKDPNFAGFVGKPVVYNIAAVYPLAKDLSNLSSWGYVATSNGGAAIFDATWNLLDNAQQKIQGYIGALNPKPFTNAPGQQAENLSGVFKPSDTGYYGQTSWGPTMGGGIGGSTEGQLDKPVDFYFVNNATGDDKGKQVVKAGNWTLSAAGQLSYSGQAILPGGNANVPPVANAGPAQTVTTGAKVSLDGSKSVDPDKSPNPSLTYNWKQTSGPSVTLAGANTVNPSFTPSKAGTYVFSLTVNDGAVDSSPATVQITVQDQVAANKPPVANAGDNQSVKAGATVTLDGSKSSDPDNGPSPLTYSWKQTSGPSVSLTGANTAKPSFAAKDAGSYGFSLTVSDGKDSATASVTVTVSAGTTPPPPGDTHFKLVNVPSLWTLRQAQTISWQSDLDGKLMVNFRFSKDGGASFRTIKNVPNRAGSFSYRFVSKSQLTQQGVIQACVRVPQKSGGKRTVFTTVCDQVNGITVK